MLLRRAYLHLVSGPTRIDGYVQKPSSSGVPLFSGTHLGDAFVTVAAAMDTAIEWLVSTGLYYVHT